jgi:hypothetical protein
VRSRKISPVGELKRYASDLTDRFNQKTHGPRIPIAAQTKSCHRFTTSGRLCSRRARSFFARDAASLKEPADRPFTKHQPLFVQSAAQLLNRAVGAFLHQGKDRCLVRLDPTGPAVPAKGLRPRIPSCRSKAPQRLKLAALTPNRSAASRCDAPVLTHLELEPGDPTKALSPRQPASTSNRQLESAQS